MKIKQLSLFIENKPGAMTAPCKLLADAGINIASLTLADTKFFGVLRLIIKDWEQAKDLLEKNNFAVRVTDVVAIEVAHEAGSLSKILSILDSTGVNVEYMYAFAGPNSKAILIFRFDDPDAAVSKLADAAEMRLLDHGTLFA